MAESLARMKRPDEGVGAGAIGRSGEKPPLGRNAKEYRLEMTKHAYVWRLETESSACFVRVRLNSNFLGVYRLEFWRLEAGCLRLEGSRTGQRELEGTFMPFT